MKQLLKIVAVVVALAATFAIGSAQGSRANPPVQGNAATHKVLSGPDVGFRLEGERNGKPQGRLVVRIDGKWVEAEFATGMRLLTK